MQSDLLNNTLPEAAWLPALSQQDLCNEEIEEWCFAALDIARRCALKSGFGSDEADDCAMDFISRMLIKYRADGGELRRAPAWLYQCARNHVVDHWRRRVRQPGVAHSKYVEWPSEDGSLREWEPADSAPGPEALLVRSVCARQIETAIANLSETQQALFVRHHLYGESIANLADSLNKSPHAVEQALLRARQRLRSLLERSGWNESEVRACLRRT